MAVALTPCHNAVRGGVCCNLTTRNTGYPGIRSDTRQVPRYKNTRKSEHWSWHIPGYIHTYVHLSTYSALFTIKKLDPRCISVSIQNKTVK